MEAPDQVISKRTAASRARRGALSRALGDWHHLRGRLSARLRAAEEAESGTVLVEALVALVVIAITIAAYTGSNATLNQVQRSQTASDIVAQQSQGVLEAAESLPWARLGANPSAGGFSSSSKYGSQWLVRHAFPFATTDDLAPTKTVNSGGVAMTQNVYVVWETCGADTCTQNRPSGAYGTKKIVVVISYRVPGSTTTKSATYSQLRTSTISEALPPVVSP